MPQHYDAIVIGLGGMGSAALAHLATRGRRVLGLERFNPAHALGSSHGQSRIIRQAYFEDPAYVPLILRAYELWADLERQTGRTIFLKTGGLMAGRTGSAVVEGSARSAREHGLAHEMLSPADLRRRFPAFHLRDNEVALWEPDAGILIPEECILAHLEVAVRAGAEARFGTRVLGWAVTPEGVKVTTGDTEAIADRLVICAGSWFSKVVSDLAIPLQVERNVMHWFAPAARAEEFGPDRFPIYILERPGAVLYGMAGLGRFGPKHGIHHSHITVDPDHVDREVGPAEIEDVRERLRDWLPDALGPHQKSVACLYTNTPDEHFVIGLHPDHPRVSLAGGFSGHGFKFGSVVGEILADLATDGQTKHPIGLFSPTRFPAGAPAPA